MCTLAIFFQQTSDYPLVLAANRDEFIERPATAPMRVREDPWIVAGVDLAAGGTWFGVNQHGVAAGILNRRTGRPVDRSRQSRGLLCLDALGCVSVEAVLAFLGGVRGMEFNPFNLLVASPTAAVVAQNMGNDIAVSHLEPGLHLLTNLDINDPTCPRIAKSHGLFAGALPYLKAGAIEEFVGQLRAVLADHSTPLDPRATGSMDNLCVHLDGYGTRSSSVLLYAARQGQYQLFHASGPPCQTAFDVVALPDS